MSDSVRIEVVAEAISLNGSHARHWEAVGEHARQSRRRDAAAALTVTEAWRAQAREDGRRSADARLRALGRLLVSEGHLTPTGETQLLAVLDAEVGS